MTVEKYTSDMETQDDADVDENDHDDKILPWWLI